MKRPRGPINPGVSGIDQGGHRARVLARRDELVTRYLPLVAAIARQVAAQLPPSFDLCDLEAEGRLALLRAAMRYRPRAHGGTTFGVYARQSVRGAMLESARRKKYTENTRPGLEAVENIARAPDTDMDETIDRARQRKRMAEAISWLPLGEQRMLREYYSAAEPTIEEVGNVLRLSTRATSALHASAIRSLRERFKAS